MRPKIDNSRFNVKLIFVSWFCLEQTLLGKDPPLLEAVPTDANIIRENNQSVRLLVKELDSDCVNLVDQPFSGCNGSNDTVDLRIMQGKTFLIPPLTSYICGDILDLKSRLQAGLLSQSREKSIFHHDTVTS